MTEKKSTVSVEFIQVLPDMKCVCGKLIRVGETMIVHGVPMCKQFEEMEPAAYLRWVRLTLYSDSELN